MPTTRPTVARCDPGSALSHATFDALLGAVRRDPGQTGAAYRCGIDALTLRREEDALPPIVAAAAKAPGDAQIPYIVGLLHRALGDLAAAILWLDRAIALTPHAPPLVYARAVSAAEAGLPSLAWFERARALAPTDGDIILGHAAALMAEGKVEAADRLLDAMLAQHPGWLPGHSSLIHIRFAAGRSDYLAALDRALAGAPRDPRLHHLRVMALFRTVPHEAAAAAQAARSLLGDSPGVLADIAVVAAEHGSLADADAAFARVDPLADPDIVIHWLRHLLRRGEPDRVAALHPRLTGDRLAAAWPYLSLAWRLRDSPQARWLERDAFIQIVDFEEDWPVLDELATLLPRLHRSTGQPIDQSVRGGTQTDGALLGRVDPPIRALRRRLQHAVDRYAAALPEPDPDHPLLGRIPPKPRFVGSWSVRLAEGGFHEPHVHGQGWLSSAFYVRVPHDAPPAGWLTLGEPQASLGLPPLSMRRVQPRAGRLVLFPSTMWHGTLPFSGAERLTIAFDVA